MQEIIIRQYKQEDRQAVREIAYDTALLGNSASTFFEDREILQDFLTKVYLDYEPQSCFVAETNNKVIGYIIGAKDSGVLNKVFDNKILAKLLLKAIRHNIILRKKSLAFMINSVISFLKGELKAPDFSKEYPATLHVNLKVEFRNQGIGSRLITMYLEYLKSEHVQGVHFATLSSEAAKFYEKLGFALLHKKNRSYFRNILHKDVTCFIFGKKL